jgi:Xaa-Pro aminopeptidase
VSEPLPMLSLKERDRRWSRTRELLRSKGFDCLVVPPKGREELIGYLSNELSEGFLIFPLKGDPVQLTWSGSRLIRRLVAAQRGVTPWVEDIRQGTMGTDIVRVLKEKGFEKAGIAVVGVDSWAPGDPEGYVPYKTWNSILKGLPEAIFTDVSEAFGEMVLVKSEEEIQLMRYSANIGEEACQTMLDRVNPGVKERDLYAAIMSVIYKAGAVSPDPFLILYSGVENLSWGCPMWHYQGGPDRTIQAGDLVFAEIFPRYAGMESQQQMSVHVQPLNPTLMECAKVARLSYEAGIKALRPGTPFKKVCEAMDAPLLEAGCWHLTPLIHSLSPLGWVSGIHGRIEQAPGMEWIRGKARSMGMRGGDLVIKPGMMFEMEPNACIRKHRVNIGGTVVVNETGVEELNKIPMEMRTR